jgi:hypothetical protein
MVYLALADFPGRLVGFRFPGIPEREKNFFGKYQHIKE